MWKNETPSKNEATGPPTTVAPTSSTPESQPERRTVAWVGKSVMFRGDLISLEDMSIDGRVEGTIELRNHLLTIGVDAHIKADIIAKYVVIRGTVCGTITATEKVEVSQTAFVEGDIASPRVAIAEGATIQGRVKTSTRSDELKPATPETATVG